MGTSSITRDTLAFQGETEATTPSASTAIQAIFDGIDEGELADLWNFVGLPTVKALLLILAALLLAKWAKSLVVKGATKARVETTLARLFGNITRWTILILAAITILQTFGVETTSFAAVVAALGFAIGMAMSGTIGNVAAGVMLLIFRPYKVGDVISAAGVTGKVHEIELFTTTLDTPDNRRIIVPNSGIFGSTIENVTFHPTRRVDVAVGTDYSADLDKTREVLMQAAMAVQGRLPDQEPVVYLSELGGSSIDWSVRVWSATADYWAVRESLTRDVKVALDNAGIGIPFPQQDVHMPESIEVSVRQS